MRSVERSVGTTSWAREHPGLVRARIVNLPSVRDIDGCSILSAINCRRSIRAFSERELTWAEIGQLLWAAQGVTDPETGHRTAPSAGALYPLEIDVLVPSGVFRYQPLEHCLRPRSTDDLREAVAQAANGQTWLANAPCILSIAAVMRRTARQYGSPAPRFVHLEAGHAAQNVLLMATALGLGATPVGAFAETALADALGLEQFAEPIYLMAVGWPPNENYAELLRPRGDGQYRDHER